MVQTRAQWRQWRENNFPSQSQCESCNEDGSFNPGSQGDRVDNANEYNNDCNRHRGIDNDPYTERVISYRRRKPKNN